MALATDEFRVLACGILGAPRMIETFIVESGFEAMDKSVEGWASAFGEWRGCKCWIVKEAYKLIESDHWKQQGISKREAI